MTSNYVQIQVVYHRNLPYVVSCNIMYHCNILLATCYQTLDYGLIPIENWKNVFALSTNVSVSDGETRFLSAQ